MPERAGKIGGSPPRIYDESRFHHNNNKNKKNGDTIKPGDNLEGSGAKPKDQTNGQKEALDSWEALFHKDVTKYRDVTNTKKSKRHFIQMNIYLTLNFWQSESMPFRKNRR